MSELTPPAQALVDVLNAISVTGHLWSPKTLSGPGPHGVVGIPSVERTPIEERESQLGADDWTLSYPVVLYFELNDITTAQLAGVDKVEEFITAIDQNAGLGGQCIEAKVTRSEPVIVEGAGNAKPHLTYECTVDVLRLVDRS